MLKCKACLADPMAARPFRSLYIDTRTPHIDRYVAAPTRKSQVRDRHGMNMNMTLTSNSSPVQCTPCAFWLLPLHRRRRTSEAATSMLCGVCATGTAAVATKRCGARVWCAPVAAERCWCTRLAGAAADVDRLSTKAPHVRLKQQPLRVINAVEGLRHHRCSSEV